MNSSLDSLPNTAFPKGGVFALGNFDGVHRGHQEVLRAALLKSRELGVPARVLTFEPHPRSVFVPGGKPFRLTPASVKIELLQAFGIDNVAVQPFTIELSQLSAADFVDRILLSHFGMQHAVAGFDFVFGHGRQGNMANLATWLSPFGIGVTEVLPFLDTGGDVLSSSRTREALETGDCETAARILGRPFAIAGVIDQGDQRGRLINVPTANIALKDYLRPRFGVYAIRARPHGKSREKDDVEGVANIGLRPTVRGSLERLEAHFFDFTGDIYGETWEIDLISFLRPESKFPDFEALRMQIMIDMQAAREKLLEF